MSATRKSVWILSALAFIGGCWAIDMADSLKRGHEVYAIALIADSIFVSSCVCTAAVLASRPDRQA